MLVSVRMKGLRSSSIFDDANVIARNGRLEDISSMDDRYDHVVDELMC
jgi:hypothetical protein